MRRSPADSANRSLAAFGKLQHIRPLTSRRKARWWWPLWNLVTIIGPTVWRVRRVKLAEARLSLSRSQQMSRVRGADTSPERRLRSALWRLGLRYRLQRRVARVRVDILFVRSKVAVFVDGCFWHGCPQHYSRPRSGTEFWSAKLVANVERDRRQTAALKQAGWKVLRVWEHEILSNVDRVAKLVLSLLEGSGLHRRPDWRVLRVVPVPKLGSDWERRELCLLDDATKERVYIGPRRTASSKDRMRPR